MEKEILLALAGGNALGAYGAGAYEALHTRGYEPDVVSGASVGAIAGGIIAGNPPAVRVERLRELWRQASSRTLLGVAAPAGKLREYHNLMHALQTLTLGRPGLFKPRLTGFMSLVPGTPPDMALYDSSPLIETLHRLIDFELLNAATLPLIVSAVDMQSGEPVYFDSRKQALEPAHFLATTAFAPAFPPVDIGGRFLADPGLIGNLPIDALLNPLPRKDALCFAVDLFDASGASPHSIDTGLERAQDIVFSHQSLRAIEARALEHRLRHKLHALSARIPSEQRSKRDQELAADARSNAITVVLIAYRAPSHEKSTKTVDFSEASVHERWAIGRRDMNAALDRLEVGAATTSGHGFTFYDARSSRL